MSEPDPELDEAIAIIAQTAQLITKEDPTWLAREYARALAGARMWRERAEKTAEALTQSAREIRRLEKALVEAQKHSQEGR